MMLPPDQSWGAVVVDDEGRFLLVHHASGGHWDSPKGHAEPHETAVETALREIREEGGVEAEIIAGFSERADWILPDGREKQVVYFLARRLGPCESAKPGDEILALAWLPYEEARDLISYESGKRVLDRAREFLIRECQSAGG